jgi:Flp pilus assembly protein TadD
MRLIGAGLFACAVLAPGAVGAQDESECTFTVERYGAAQISAGCEKALTAMPGDKDRADLLYRLGYAMIENDAVLGSLDVLRRAVSLAPGNAGYWHELGFAQADLGMYAEALASLNRAVALDPQHANAINERGWVRQKLGDFAGANEDYDRYFAIEGETPGTRLSHARNLVWLGKLDEAAADLDLLAGEADLAEDVAEQRELIARMRAYRPTGDEAAVCELSDALSDQARAQVIFDACTRAFLDSGDPLKRADYLTVRATARQTIEQTLGVGYEELSLAAGIDPHNGTRYANTGFALLQLRHSWAARNDFDRALELGLMSDLVTAVALGGRARANFNLEDREAAVADARRSIEIEPNESATWVLGDIASADGNNELAREMWLATYRLGSRDDRLMDNLRSVGVDDPESWRDDDTT